MPFNLGSPLKTPSSRKLLESSRAPLTLTAKSPRTDPAEPGAAGATPGSSRPSSKKFRPSSGRPVIWRFSTTPPSAVELVRRMPAAAVTSTAVQALAGQQRNLDPDFPVKRQRELLEVLAIALVLGLDPVLARREIQK